MNPKNTDIDVLANSLEQNEALSDEELDVVTGGLVSEPTTIPDEYIVVFKDN